MKFKELKSEKDLEKYRHAIAKHIDVLLPLEYLKQGHVFAFVNDDHDICGGFALITKGPFRVLNSIPKFEGLKFDPKLKHTAEITGVWLSKNKTNHYASLRFWLAVLGKVLTSRKKYFVYAYSTRKTGLKNIYARANPEVIFCGETKILPGMPAPDHETIEVVFRKRILLQAFKNPDFFVNRIIPKKKSIHIKDTYETDGPIIPIIATSTLDLGRGQSKINR